MRRVVAPFMRLEIRLQNKTPFEGIGVYSDYRQYNVDLAYEMQSDAKFPLHDVDTGHGRRFGARQVWRANSVSDKLATRASAGFRLDKAGHILASAALVALWS